MNKKKLIVLIGLLTILFTANITPVLAWKADTQPTGGNLNVEDTMSNIIDKIWIIFAAFAVIMFIYAGIMFLTANGEASKLTTARHAVLWGVIGVIVGILAFSIVSIAGELIGGAAK